MKGEMWYNYSSSNRINSQGAAINSPWPDTRKVLLMQPHSIPQPSALKVCTKCGESKPLSEYYIHKTGRLSGKPFSRCAECLRTIRREGRDKHAENASYRQKIASDPEYRKKRNDKSRAWREENRVHIAEYDRRIRAEMEGRATFYNRQWRERYPERVRAHYAVAHAVRVGEIPPASTLICEHCQEAQAANYHHHNGYEPEFWLDVVALCTECHGREHRRD